MFFNNLYNSPFASFCNKKGKKAVAKKELSGRVCVAYILTCFFRIRMGEQWQVCNRFLVGELIPLGTLDDVIKCQYSPIRLTVYK